MPSRLSRALAASCAVVVVAVLTTVSVLGGQWTGTSTPDAAGLVWFLSFLVFPATGLLIAWRRPHLAVGWVYLAVGVAQVVAGGLSTVAEHADAVGAVELAAWTSLIGTLAFGTAWSLATNLALLVFPVQDVPVPWRRGLLWAAAACYAVLVVGYSVGDGPVEDDLGLVSPLAVAAWGPWPHTLADLAVLGQVAITITVLVTLVVAWRRSTGSDRTRLMWLGFGALVALIVASVGSLVAPWGPSWVGPVTEAVVVASLPLATAVAVLRAGLFDVAAVLDRTIVYAVLTGIVLTTYFVVLALVTGLIGDDAGRGASLLASALVAVFLAPVKDRLSRLVERWVYGERAEPYRVLANLAERLERTTAVDDLIATVTETVRRTLRLPYVDVALDAAAPTPAGAVALPLLAHGRQEGTLVVGCRSGQAAFTSHELRLLQDLARQVAREVRVARLATDLQESRERLVRAREEERLRVRRDLHDGVGPTLAAAGLQVEALIERWPPPDRRAAELLGKINDEISQAVVDVRGVVDGLRPPALDDLGLAGVVREHADALSAAGLAVSVACPDPLRVPSAAAEVAAYRIVTESLTNVVRHSGAARCHVTLDVHDGWLCLEVSDDGTAADAPRHGVGLTSMQERAAEIGGTLTVTRGPTGGTTVSARLPMGGAA
jgi:signal transduction histidine kinase